MNQLPLNCPLTLEQFASLPEKVQTSSTMIWVKDAANPGAETLDRIVSVCNRGALKQLAHLYFDASRPTTQHAQPITPEDVSGEFEVNLA